MKDDVVAEIQQGFARAFLAFLWFNAGLVACLSYVRDTLSLAPVTLFACILALVPTLAWQVPRLRRSTPVLGAVAIASLVALLVAAAGTPIQTPAGQVSIWQGPTWQVDMHMYFFACMAICVGWLDWRAIVAFGVFTTLHHAGTSYVVPQYLFPDGGSLPRVLLHGLIVAAEGVILVWVIRRVREAVSTARAALDVAKISADETDALRLAAEARSVVDGRWRHDIQGQIAQLIIRMGDIGETVSCQMTRMDDTARTLSSGAEATIRQIVDAEEAARQTSLFVREVAASAAALAAGEREIGVKISRTNTVTREAAATTREMMTRVETLAEAGRRISDVVRVIDGIASQTNLLALNATIEAARAGDAGRGFAIVAQEVKALAGETARSTADIANLAASIQEAGKEALAAVAAIEAEMARVDGSTRLMATAIEEQSVTTSTIRESALRMEHGTAVVVQAIGSVTGAAADASSASTEVGEATRSVSAAVDELKLAVCGFLEGVAPQRLAA